MNKPLSSPPWSGAPDQLLDCVIVGGGPGGLTAAVYLTRFLRNCVVIDAGSGRAASIPVSHNLPGFPEGISGADLLARLGAQLSRYGGLVTHGEVDAIIPSNGNFLVSYGLERLRSRSIILATGVVNHRPALSDAMHNVGVRRGLIRYCPICDGYEARHGSIAVLGADRHGAEEALFLSGYGAMVTLLAQQGLDLPADAMAALHGAGVQVISTPVAYLDVTGSQVQVLLRDEQRLSFDTLYPALGSSARSSLATSIGAKASASGCLVTDAHQRTTVKGLYAVGDVVDGLDQISVAAGHAATAATAIHNYLRELDDLVGPNAS